MFYKDKPITTFQSRDNVIFNSVMDSQSENDMLLHIFEHFIHDLIQLESDKREDLRFVVLKENIFVEIVVYEFLKVILPGLNENLSLSIMLELCINSKTIPTEIWECGKDLNKIRNRISHSSTNKNGYRKIVRDIKYDDKLRGHFNNLRKHLKLFHPDTNFDGDDIILYKKILFSFLWSVMKFENTVQRYFNHIRKPKTIQSFLDTID
ncbi:hypothetical protein ACKGJO_10425 [Gracilimonas sp. Q87]|uniref:hypothetical protein n=1 Tax=Gracilimonas sp. Q87 TaxID=3384766 RepID=UPI0039844FBF